MEFKWETNMAQMTYGILFGIVSPDSDLFRKWERIKGLANERPYPYIGFWVAVGASGKDHAPYLDDVCVDSISKKYKNSFNDAKKHWKVFVEWATKKGVKVPPAKLWLIETEVA
jgi:hypothetical protein